MELPILSADDVTAIRAASGFSVHLNGETDSATATFSVYRKVKVPQVKGAVPEEQELRRTITCKAGTTQGGYFGDLYRPGQWIALGLLIRPGDALIFTGRKSNNSQYLDAAKILPGTQTSYGERMDPADGLHRDELLVTIIRKGKTLVHEWPITDTVTPDNSARGCRPLRLR